MSSLIVVTSQSCCLCDGRRVRAIERGDDGGDDDNGELVNIEKELAHQYHGVQFRSE